MFHLQYSSKRSSMEFLTQKIFTTSQGIFWTNVSICNVYLLRFYKGIVPEMSVTDFTWLLWPTTKSRHSSLICVGRINETGGLNPPNHFLRGINPSSLADFQAELNMSILLCKIALFSFKCTPESLIISPNGFSAPKSYLQDGIFPKWNLKGGG